MDAKQITKQAIYRKQAASQRGRAWEIQILGDTAPFIGEHVQVVKKSGGTDIVAVRDIFVRQGQIFCSFETIQRSGFNAPQIETPINVNEFLSPAPTPAPVTAPESPQDAPQSTDGPTLAQVQASARTMLNRLIQSEGAAQAHASAANQAASNAHRSAIEASEAIERAAKRVPELVKETLESMRPVVIQLGKDEAKQIKLEGHQHPLFEKVLRLANAGINVLLVGEAGCGKSFLAHQIAQALGLAFGTLHCTAGMSESQISGWLLPTGDGGKFEYHPADFVTKFQSGNSLFLLDEIDAADPNVLMFMNGALANGALHIPHRLVGPEVLRGERAIIMGAANTYGHGANARYAGRNQLDGATLDRFYVVEMDYDNARERGLFGEVVSSPIWKPADAPTSTELKELGEWVLSLRERARKAQLRRIVSSRTLAKALEARKAGIPTAEIKRDTLAGWTQDEKAKVGEA